MINFTSVQMKFGALSKDHLPVNCPNIINILHINIEVTVKIVFGKVNLFYVNNVNFLLMS